MSFFKNKNNTDKPAPRRRSLITTLFVPDVAASARPLRETTAIFINLIAMLFAANGLFPKNHPAFARNSAVRLSFNDVMHTAWQNVSFTKEKLPQTIFFFAVVGCIAVTGISAFIAACSLFVGKAHAQTFTPPGPGCSPLTPACTDMAQQFINYLFQAQTFTALDQNSSGAPQSPVGTGGDVIIQCALYTALGFYSDAILIVAAMILFYHLAWMTVETAHHGVVMGQRGNQIWAPIRLVFAIGLLVPVGGAAPALCPGGTGTGMNSGQFLVIAVAQWGSGLASNVWATFLNAVAADNTYDYVPPEAPNVRKTVEDVLQMYACQYAYNWELDSGSASDPAAVGGALGPGPGYPNPPGSPLGNTALDQFQPAMAADFEICEPNTFVGNPYAIPCPTGAPDPYVITSADPVGPGYASTTSPQTDGVNNGSTRYTFGNQSTADLGMCGSYVIPASPVINDSSFVGVAEPASKNYEQQIVDGIYSAETDAFSNMLVGASAQAFQYIPYWREGNQSFQLTPPNPTPDVVTTLVINYQTNLETGIQNAMTSVDGDTDDADEVGLTAAFTNAGWLTAGAWFNRVARVQQDITASGRDALPQTTPPLLPMVIQLMSKYSSDGSWNALSGANNATVNTDYVKANDALISFQGWLKKVSLNAGATVAGNMQQQRGLACFELGTSPVGPDTYSPVDTMFWIIDHLAACNGVWRPVQAGGGAQENLLGVQFLGANPLAEVAAFGNANVNTAYDAANWGIALSGIGGYIQGHYPTLPSGQSTNDTLNSLGSAVQSGGGLFLFAAGIFFTIGFAMAFFVPLIPFISFFFGVLTWVVAMLEAVIAVPLVALAHLNPEGAGLPGDLARTAYFFIFQVFLRPVLMIFGLLVGFLIFYLAVAFLNTLFPVAVAGTGGLSHGHFTAARIIYSVIYVLLVVSSANHSFQLITRLPDTAMQWMGQSGLQGANMGEAATLERDVAGIQAYVTQQGIGQVGQMGGGIGKLAGTIGARGPKYIEPEKAP